MSYKPYKIQLTNNQKLSLAKAYRNNQAIVIRLKNIQLKGSDELMLTQTQINKINNSIKKNKGLDLKISQSQIHKVVQNGGNLFTTLVSLGTKLVPLVSKVAPKILSGLATGALSTIGDISMKKILGKGLQNRPSQNFTGGYQIPFQNLSQLANVFNLLNKTQQKEYKKAVKNGSGMNIRLTKAQNGGFLGTLLATIGIPLLLKALTGSGKGHGLQNRPVNFNENMQPPFIGNWNTGKGVKKKRLIKKKKASGLILGPNSPLKNVPILGAIF